MVPTRICGAPKHCQELEWGNDSPKGPPSRNFSGGGPCGPGSPWLWLGDVERGLGFPRGFVQHPLNISLWFLAIRRLNLFSLLAFHWLEMLVMAECEQLPVLEARAGDPAAWDALFRRYQLPLYVYIFELVHDEQASLEIVQETFINAARHIAGLREDAKFGSWLFGIAHQKCLQHWRKQMREEAALDQVEAVPVDFEAGPDELLIRHEQQEEFMRLLNQLPPPQRSVLLLHFVEDFSIDQIAEITGTAPGTVKSRLYYAKRTLRKLLGEEP